MEELKRHFLSPSMWVSIGIAFAAIAVTMVLNRSAKRYLRQANLKGKRATNAQVGVALARYMIYVMATFLVLQVNGVNVGTLAASLGLATAAVAFAVQDLLKDFIMGANILSGDFFSLGDVVEYEGMTAVVRSFNIRVTKLYDIDTGNVFAISNRNITEIRRVSDWQDIIIPTGYDEDVVEMRTVCLEICEKIEGLSMVKSCEFLGTDAFQSHCVDYRVRLHCNPARRNTARRAALGVVQDVFRAHGIAIPFPQMDVHMKNSAPAPNGVQNL